VRAVLVVAEEMPQERVDERAAGRSAHLPIMPRRYAARMLGTIIAALASAFVTGALARFAVPGPDPMPAWLTVVIGLGGTVIGGGIVLLAIGQNPSWVGIASFMASIALVVIYRRFIQQRPLWGPDAYRFPKKGFGVEQYRERLQRAGIDPDQVMSPFNPAAVNAKPGGGAPAPTQEGGGDPTENPAYYLRLIEELHDNGVLNDAEYDSSRLRLLERLRA
jgi:uncharacterized membrane protein YeaQ/YmgE (transglycosylase-associated protein family)